MQFYYADHDIPMDEKMEMDGFALALTEEFIMEMPESKREFVKNIFCDIRNSPERAGYLPAALNEALRCYSELDIPLFVFRKNYSLLEENLHEQ